jgi:KDO2-lipid IV(A) lauroyltransferase
MIRHGIEYGFVLLFFGLIRLTPQRLAPPLSRCLGRLARLFTPKRVQIALANLRAALPDLADDKHEQIVRAVYTNLAGNAVDSTRPLQLLSDIEITPESREHLRRAFERGQTGRPQIFVGGHFGNWELLAQFLATRFPGLAIMAKAQRNRFVDRFINRQREITGGRIIPSHRASRLLTPIFKQGGALYFVADQDAGAEGITVEFFGLPTNYARGLALYSFHYDAALIPVFLQRRNPGFRLEVGEPILPQPQAEKGSEIVRLIRAYSDALEKRVRTEPAQWLWTHRRWKSTLSTPAGS